MSDELGGDQPVGGGTVNDTMKDAFRGDTKVEKSDLKQEFNAYDGPYGVIDPRLIGHFYPSYMFIESGDRVSSGFDNRGDVFYDDNRALMIGAVLGEYDFVSRRADLDQFRHAQFSVEAIDSSEKSFIRSAETYPIFSIARWHGQNVPINNMTLSTDIRDLDRYQPSDIECEFLYERNRNPEGGVDEWVDNIEQRASVDEGLIDKEEVADRIDDSGGAENIALGLDDYILGQSIGISPANLSGYQHLIVGISVKEGVETENGDQYDLPNEKVMHNIRDQFDRWTMPYIVSGVGKSWGDILVEIHTDTIDDMERYARELREDVDGVRSTRTFALTGTSFNRPLKLASPSEINI